MNDNITRKINLFYTAFLRQTEQYYISKNQTNNKSSNRTSLEKYNAISKENTDRGAYSVCCRKISNISTISCNFTYGEVSGNNRGWKVFANNTTCVPVYVL